MRKLFMDVFLILLFLQQCYLVFLSTQYLQIQWLTISQDAVVTEALLALPTLTETDTVSVDIYKQAC